MYERELAVIKEFQLASVIRLYGILHPNDLLELYEAMNVAIAANAKIIIVDIRRLKFIDSGASQILDNCKEKAQKHKIELLICS